MKKKRKTGVILYLTTEDFFMNYVKKNPLNTTQIIIISRDIISSIKKKEQYNSILYDSKYDNIDFVPTLLPTPSSLEYAYGDDKSRFREAYEGHLLGDDEFSDILCIADMVVNDGIDVILLSSKAEFASTFPYILKELVQRTIGLNICLGEQLAEAETDEEYDKLLDLGDIEEIKRLISYNMVQILSGGIDEKDASKIFFNRFMENAPTKYRKILMTKSEEELLKMAREKGLRLSRKKSKDEIINAITTEVFGATE